MPKVSVIVPMYNTEKFLRPCLDSILKQTLDDIEIIIVDDCSTDNSFKIASEYAKKHSNIRLVRQAKNSGVAAARNMGLHYAKGKYISFIDSDDYIQDNMLEKMYNACEKTSSPVARVNRQLVYKGQNVAFLGRNCNYDSFEVVTPGKTDYLYKEVPACTNKLFLREFIQDRSFPTNLKWEDYPYTVPIIASSPSIAIVPDSTYFYNVNTGGTTVNDFRVFNPRVLDIFDCSDIIGDACITERTPESIKEQVEFIQIQNCLQRLRDILYSDLKLKDKKELMTLVSALINKKYGSWQTNPLYQESLKRYLYRIRMKLIEILITPYDTSEVSEQELRGKIKQKIDDIKKQS